MSKPWRLVQTRLPPEVSKELDARLAREGRTAAQWLRELVLAELAAVEAPAARTATLEQAMHEALTAQLPRVRELERRVRELERTRGAPSESTAPRRGGLCAWGDYATPSHRCPVHDGTSSRKGGAG